MTAKLFATAHEVAEALGVKDTRNCLGLTLRVRAQEIPTLTVHQFAPDSSQLKTISERFALLPINEVPDKRLAATQQQAAHPQSVVHEAARQLVDLAEGLGQVVTIERTPLYPLAMGNAEYLVAVREKRGPQ